MKQTNALKPDFSQVANEDLAYRYLSSYIAFQNPTYRVTPHTTLLCKALEAVERGDIRRLMISMPPRHGKTMHVSEYFPPWYLGRNPTHQIIATTYNYERASDVGRMVRNQFIDSLHPSFFSGCTISPDSKSVYKLSTLQGGNYFSVGIGGTVIGRGANLFLIDDPVKSRRDAESSAVRTEIQNFYKSVAYTRLQPDNRIVIVMTRWYFDDLIGWLLKEKKEAWHVISMPAIAENECQLTQRVAGDPLWVSDYPLPTLLQIKKSIGTREWLSQYQQKPLNEDGDILKLGWFGRFNLNEWFAHEALCRATREVPSPLPFDIIQIVMSLDTAFKEEEMHDPTSCSVWGISKNGYYLLEVFNKRMGFPELKKRTIRIWNKYNRFTRSAIPVLIEDRASGQSLIQVLKLETNIPVISIKADKNKKVRAAEVSSVVEAGRVFLPLYADWLERTETQISQFPLADEDDDVDSITQFLRWASKPKMKRRKLRFWK